jgi:hypothetical protein
MSFDENPKVIRAYLTNPAKRFKLMTNSQTGYDWEGFENKAN